MAKARDERDARRAAASEKVADFEESEENAEESAE